MSAHGDAVGETGDLHAEGAQQPREIHRRGLALRVGIGRHDDLVDAAGGDALDEGLDLQIVGADVVHR